MDTTKRIEQAGERILANVALEAINRARQGRTEKGQFQEPPSPEEVLSKLSTSSTAMQAKLEIARAVGEIADFRVEEASKNPKFDLEVSLRNAVYGGVAGYLASRQIPGINEEVSSALGALAFSAIDRGIFWLKRQLKRRSK